MRAKERTRRGGAEDGHCLPTHCLFRPGAASKGTSSPCPPHAAVPCVPQSFVSAPSRFPAVQYSTLQRRPRSSAFHSPVKLLSFSGAASYRDPELSCSCRVTRRPASSFFCRRFTLPLVSSGTARGSASSFSSGCLRHGCFSEPESGTGRCRGERFSESAQCGWFE